MCNFLHFYCSLPLHIFTALPSVFSVLHTLSIFSLTALNGSGVILCFIFIFILILIFTNRFPIPSTFPSPSPSPFLLRLLLPAPFLHSHSALPVRFHFPFNIPLIPLQFHHIFIDYLSNCRQLLKQKQLWFLCARVCNAHVNRCAMQMHFYTRTI